MAGCRRTFSNTSLALALILAVVAVGSATGQGTVTGTAYTYTFESSSSVQGMTPDVAVESDESNTLDASSISLAVDERTSAVNSSGIGLGSRSKAEVESSETGQS